MKIVLHIKNHKTHQIQELVFNQEAVLLGRSRICDIPISDPVLSRQHCTLQLDATRQKVQLRDLDSANGTFVEGNRVKELELKTGAAFILGETEVQLTALDWDDEEPTLDEPVEELASAITETNKIEATRVMPKVGKDSASAFAKRVASGATVPSRAEEVTLKTPVIFKKRTTTGAYKTKDWVQVSLFWKTELVDMRCFDQGAVVTLGESPQNDFTVAIPSLPLRFEFLKILKTGMEVRVHPSMKGVVETRKSTRSLEDLKLEARQTDIGLSAFVDFDDRCLIEVGPFSIFVQSVRLELAAPLSASIIEDPFYFGVTTTVGLVVLGILMFLSTLAPPTLETPPEQPVVKLENPNVIPPAPPPPPPPPPPPTPKKVEAKKTGKKAQKKVHMEGKEGAGARALGAEGKTGRTTGHIAARARPIGIITKVPRPLRSAPKGAFGKEKNPNLAKRGLRPDQGTGSGKPKPKGSGTQAASKHLAPKVNMEDQGLMGALNGAGGGGKASRGGVLEGQGLGGELEGSVEGLERGSDIDSRGSGGRGAKGLGLGGGGTSVEVGGLATKGKGGGRSGFGLGTSGKKGDADVSYSVEEVEVLDGLTREEIARVVRAHEREVQTCYETSLLGGNKSLNGRLKIRWFVNSAGRVENTQQVAGIAGGESLYSCIASHMQSWQFPKPRGGKGAQVDWPWVFHKTS